MYSILIWKRVFRIVVGLLCAIAVGLIVSGAIEGSNKTIMERHTELLNSMSGLKEDIAILQAALKAHDTKPLWWEAE